MARYPRCPQCGSTAKRCKRASGHEAAEWHSEREDIVALDCMCEEICLPWLRRRGKLPATLQEATA